MRVLAWVPQEYDTSPGQRYRLEQWEPHLRKAGIDVAYSPFSSRNLTRLLQRPGRTIFKAGKILGALGRRLREARHLRSFDVLYIFREGALLGPALAERIAVRTRIPMVFDFDDAVWIRYVSPANSRFSYLRFPGKIATICRLAQHVIAGNSYLQQYAERYNPAVSVVPTTIDTEKYQPRSVRRAGPPVIGWTGSYSTVQYLQLVKPVLERLRRRHNFRMVIISGAGFEAEGLEIEHRTWDSATEVADLWDVDIGIMPLPDEEWERGKCGCKVLQYMGAGIPSVASPVGVNREIIEDGHNGLLAQSQSEWESTLERLLASADLRRRLGAAGRATVEGRYSAAMHSPRVVSILRAAASRESGVRQRPPLGL